MPNNITKVLVDRIELGDRKRAVDNDMVKVLQDDIRAIGLLQPIGIRQMKDSHDYELIWGAHRLLAFKAGWENARKLLNERDARDPEALLEAKLWQQIPAVVHDWMPNTDAEMKEISENLHRKALSPQQTTIQRARYVALLKKTGVVVPIGEKRSEDKKQQKGTKSPEVTLLKPTAAAKAAKDLGVSRKTISQDFKDVSAMASAVARDTNSPKIKVTPESPAEKIDEAIDLAQLAVDEKLPIDRTPDNITIVRVDITDPKFIGKWFKEKVDAAEKPLTLEFLEGLAYDLLAFISERRNQA